ncbi:hypothetical protein [Vibrio lentus]|uniref:hypothetical protein n=1 Tax=Vibrio lentus TaxID=136468 RepID=UPI000C822BB6|nr:hypothetical protein [Vibrio lentus]PMI88659.1 hypothetical protein BCU35_08480 [Vibrio lentus]
MHRLYKHSCFIDAGLKSCDEEKKREVKSVWLLWVECCELNAVDVLTAKKAEQPRMAKLLGCIPIQE